MKQILILSFMMNILMKIYGLMLQVLQNSSKRGRTSYGYMEIPYTQAKEANNFIHKSRNLEKMRILKK